MLDIVLGLGLDFSFGIGLVVLGLGFIPGLYPGLDLGVEVEDKFFHTKKMKH